MKELTPRQAEILQLIRDTIAETGFPPTRAEIARMLDFASPNAAEEHLRALERKGVLEILDGTARGIRLKEAVGLPLVGRVAAGSPVLAEENIEDQITVGPEIAGGEDAYALRVHGESMIEAGIYDGDIVVVRPQREAPNGTIVVARIENELTGEHEVTVKRFYREPGRVRLQPENAHMQPIYARDLQLEGVVTAVIRLLT